MSINSKPSVRTAHSRESTVTGWDATSCRRSPDLEPWEHRRVSFRGNTPNPLGTGDGAKCVYTIGLAHRQLKPLVPL